ncbi:MAG TPA: di-heme oxidoredictase family protein [Candidatus Binatia bacterium]|nr:di-heme oxidoredictase family protein [Candidatus Binatia bacterium]
MRVGATLPTLLLTAALAAAQLPPATTVVSFVGFGAPLDGILEEAAGGNETDFAIWAHGQRTFTEVDSLPQLGPLFNSRSCGACHFQPALGGSGQYINEVRVRHDTAGGPLHIFAADNLLRARPQSQAGTTIFPAGLEATPLGCQITDPRCRWSPCQREEARRTTFRVGLPLCDPTSTRFLRGANCTAERQATPLFGLGLVEAVGDGTLVALAASQPAAIRGTVKWVTELGRARVARFGWKDDHATLRAFAGDAYLNEVGITNPDFPTDRSACALGKRRFGVLLDARDDPEDATDADGRADVDRFTDFMRGLAPPPALGQTASAEAGHALFTALGCGGCHVESLTTDPAPASFIPPSTGGVPVSASLAALLAGQTFHPYSDFLLHDVGALGDGITSGAAGPRLMRTAPLWGVRGKSRFLHDGRAPDLATAVTLHDGQAQAAATAFRALSAAQQQSLVDFLNSL